MAQLKVAELFAGVGGFREAMVSLNAQVGAELFRMVWSNQWEPSESGKKGEEQFANRVYIEKFGHPGHYADDIHKVSDIKGPIPKSLVPEIDLLVGGFPCQDYSVAKPKNVSKGLRGPKGVLWWSIERLLEERAPDYVLLENVDRLINSPANNRGRDFAVILKGFQELGYAVEWRVVNAAEYGFPQKRRRIFILAYKLKTAPGKALKSAADEPAAVLVAKGVLAQSLPCTSEELIPELYDLNKFKTDVDVKDRYAEKSSPFLSAGFMLNGEVHTLQVDSVMKGRPTFLRDLLVKPGAQFYPSAAGKFSIPAEDAGYWAYAKGRKNEPRRKQVALVAFLKSQLKGEAAVTKAELAEAAKKLPGQLALDHETTIAFEGREEKKLRLAREELNFKVASLLGQKANPLRPNFVSRSDVKIVQDNQVLRRELEAHVTGIMADRAISLLALKGKAEQEKLRKSLGPKVRQAITALLGKNPTARVTIGKVELSLDRDTVSGASFAYGYKEGGMAFPDPLDAPGRTIITSEGGASVSRFKHVICDDCAQAGRKLDHDCGKEGRLRRLFPRELEAMNGFSGRHSEACEKLKISDGRRAFFMGNALVVGVVERILKALVS